MTKVWIGRCAVCGKTNGYFQRATYVDAPDGGVTVHPDCLQTFFKSLEDPLVGEEQWKLQMEKACWEEEERQYKEDHLKNVAHRRDLDTLPSTRKWNPDSHGTAAVGERDGSRQLFGAFSDTRCHPTNDGLVDIEPLLRFLKGNIGWAHIDFKTVSNPRKLVLAINVKKIDIQIDLRVIYVLMQHIGRSHPDEDIFKRKANPLGWIWARDVKKYPVIKRWNNNDADVHLVPHEELRSVDILKAAYQGRWRWHDTPNFPPHPQEGFPARYQPK